MVHETVAKLVMDQVTGLGWTNTPPATPFGAPQVTFLRSLPREWEQLSRLESGRVAITLGDEMDALEEEMGGPLVSQEIPLFVDIFFDEDVHALALATDVRDIFKGRIGPGPYLNLLDFTQTVPTPVAGWQIELTDVERGAVDRRAGWQVVKVTASTFFQEELTATYGTSGSRPVVAATTGTTTTGA
jgi:hypothetical protein